ncbi:MAG: hypothetical protein BHV69_10180 [Bacteroidales bacterium 52_46]|nr:MAG: hypothetical protein BHV69_10180 [Bacteroidales bacterium 52_46]
MNNPVTIRERILVFIHHLGLSIQTFSYRCNLSQNAVLKLNENSQNGTFSKIYTTFPELNPKWLQFGNGEMLRPTVSNISDDKNFQQVTSGDYIILSQEEIKNAIMEFSKALLLVDKQMGLYAESIAQKDEQISRLLAMVEVKDSLINKIMDKL